MKISKGNAEHYVWGDQCDGWFLVKNEQLSVIHERMPAGTAEARHYHQRARQFFFILSGTATFELDGEIHMVDQHEGIEVAPNTPHHISNQTDDAIEFLVISQPSTQGDRILTE